jgi:hypothetical protein
LLGAYEDPELENNLGEIEVRASLCSHRQYYDHTSSFFVSFLFCRP